jgi:hypothetical protein
VPPSHTVGGGYTLSGRPLQPGAHVGWTSKSDPSYEPEPGAFEVTVEGKRDRNFESPHDGEADAVREAQAGVIQALVYVEGRLFQREVRADDVDDAAGQEQARETNGPRRAQPDPDQRDRFVQDVMGREEPWPVPQGPALDRPGLPVVPIARVLQGVKARGIDKDSGQGLSAARDRDGGRAPRRRVSAPTAQAGDRPGRMDRPASPCQ